MPNPCLKRAAFARLGFVAAIALAVFYAAMGPRMAHAEGRGGPAVVSAASRKSGMARVAPQNDVIALASHWLGQGNPTPFREAWCRDFVNMVLERAGMRLADRSHLAIAALRLGMRVRDPRPGDLVVLPHHVAFFARWDDDGAIIALGGNQGHRVSIARFGRRAVIAFVRVE